MHTRRENGALVAVQGLYRVWSAFDSVLSTDLDLGRGHRILEVVLGFSETHPISEEKHDFGCNSLRAEAGPVLPFDEEPQVA